MRIETNCVGIKGWVCKQIKPKNSYFRNLVQRKPWPGSCWIAGGIQCLTCLEVERAALTTREQNSSLWMGCGLQEKPLHLSLTGLWSWMLVERGSLPAGKCWHSIQTLGNANGDIACQFAMSEQNACTSIICCWQAIIVANVLASFSSHSLLNIPFSLPPEFSEVITFLFAPHSIHS